MANIWIAASDGNTAQVISYLSSNPSLVNAKDDNGYTTIHAAASYGHLDLLRKLVNEYGGDVNIRDDDGDTPLFTAETVEVARCLVEELGADWACTNDDGLTAAETIEADETYPLVATYLRSLASKETTRQNIANAEPGSPPKGIAVNVRSLDQAVEELEPVDDEFKRKIEELAARPGEFTQEELRQLVTEAVHKHVLEPEGRNVRARDGD
ncbi:Tankyrase-2 [Dactylellina cionopaga]|nr:Tankyrase-2 [Dactylellina cionopaga]